MPINFTDFSHIAPQKLPDFLGEAVRGYQAGRMPHAIRQEEEKNRLANALKELEYQYKPQEYEQDILGKKLTNQSAQNKLNVEPRMLALALQAKERGERLGEGYDEQLIRSKLEQARAAMEAQRAHGEYYNAQANKLSDSLKEENNPEIPQGAVRFNELSKPEQAAIAKEMRGDLRRAEDVYKADRTLDEMKKIITEHPDLSDTMANILIDPKSSSILSKIARSQMDQKDREALEKFTKLSNDLVLQAGTALGAKNFTDAKLRVLETAKPTSLNTSEANAFLIDKMKEEFAPWKGYAEDIKKGLKHRYVVEFDLDKYRVMNNEGNFSAERKEANPAQEEKTYRVLNNETNEYEYLTEQEAKDEGLI